MCHEVVEQFCCGKRSASLCEDGVFVDKHFAVVIDGSTSKASHEVAPTMSNGRMAMLTIRDAMATMPADVSPEQLCVRLNDAIHRQYVQFGADIEQLRREPSLRATASVIVYSAHAHKIWMIGDCQCMVDGTLHTNEKPGECILAAKRAAVIAQLLADRHTVDELRGNDLGRAAIIDELRASLVLQNVTYAVIDGFSTFMPGVRTVDTTDANEIILASDGYPSLHPTLAQTEEALRHIIATDPLMTTIHPATKGLMHGATTFDDRTYLRIHVKK